MNLSRITSLRDFFHCRPINIDALSDEEIWNIDIMTMLQKPITDEEYSILFIANYQDSKI